MSLTEAPDQLGALAAMSWSWMLAFLPRLAAALLLLVAGLMLAGWAARAVTRLAARSGRVDATLWPVLAAVARYAVVILVIVAALGQLGVQTASVLAVLGAAGLAIGLALQGTLANIAAGIMLLWLRPFRLGDYVETEKFAGTIREIGLFVCHLDTGDGLFLFVPNAELWNKPLKNHSRNPRRLVSLDFVLPRDTDVAAARRLLLEAAGADGRVLADPPAEAAVAQLGEATVTMTLRAWVASGAHLAVQDGLLEAAKTRLRQAGLEGTA